MTDTKPPDTHTDDDLVAADDTVIGHAFRASVIVLAILALAAALLVWTFARTTTKPPPHESTRTAPRPTETTATPPTVTFTDVTADAGIDFLHQNGAAGDKLMPETMGSGCAFLDYDNDGHQDILLVNATHWPDTTPTDQPPPTMALYHNDGTGHFKNVTPGSGLDVSFYGTGIAVGDYDNDGRVDVFIAAVGENHLFHNLTDVSTTDVPSQTTDVPSPLGSDEHTETAPTPTPRFLDVTQAAGVAGQPDRWSTSAAFIDTNNDGLLDLFVGNYIKWSRQIDFEVDYRLVGVGRAYGPPMNFQGTFPYLYKNNGDGTFTDVSAQSGIQIKNPATGTPVAKTLGLAPVDIDRDGWIDILLANDTVANFLFHNRGDGQPTHVANGGVGGGGTIRPPLPRGDSGGAASPLFEESAALYGLAYDREGNATGAMGVDAAHYRNDDALGFFIGNFANEMTSAYITQPDPIRRHEPRASARADVSTLFADEAITEGIGAPSRLMLTFGLFLFDYDLDGRLDLFQANGHLEQEINVVQASQHYAQPPQLFWNAGPDHPRCFVPVTPPPPHPASTESDRAPTELDPAPIAPSDHAPPPVAHDKTTRRTVASPLAGNDNLPRNAPSPLAGNDNLPRNAPSPLAGDENTPRARPRNSNAPLPRTTGPEPTNDLFTPLVARAAAYADIDADGDLDILITQTGRRAVLLRNDQSLHHNWVRLKLIGTSCNRDAVGAWIECQLDDTTIHRQVMPTRSYQSQVELPVTLGLGPRSTVPPITITWPDAATQTLTGLPPNQTHIIHQPTPP